MTQQRHLGRARCASIPPCETAALVPAPSHSSWGEVWLMPFAKCLVTWELHMLCTCKTQLLAERFSLGCGSYQPILRITPT